MRTYFQAARGGLNLLALVLWAAVVATACGEAGTAAPQRKMFPDSIVPIESQPGMQLGPPTAKVDANQRMTLMFAQRLPQDAQEKLERVVREGKVLTSAE